MPPVSLRWSIATALLVAPLAAACTGEPSGPCEEGFELDARDRCVRWVGIRGLDDRGAASGQLLPLADGRVLSWSSRDPIQVVDPDAELRRWDPIQPPPFELVTAMAQLADGSVLALGGQSEPSARFTARWDPGSDTWSEAAAAPLGDVNADDMISLEDGTALIVGAGAQGQQPASWIYDGAVAGLSATAAPAGYAAILAPLGDNKVIRIGQVVGPPTAPLEAEIFDASTEEWRRATAPEADGVMAAASLPNGDLLVTFWSNDNGREAWIYAPLVDGWRPASQPIAGGALAPLGDGAILSMGGEAGHDAEVYDPELDAWFVTASPWPYGGNWVVAPLGDGRVIAKVGSESAIFEQL
jgi:hypothetical protein